MFCQKDKQMKKIAIIGSGITGLSVAFQQPLKSSITMFDKSRRPGGRVSTRVSRQHPGYSFDHGAPFVYAKGQFLEHLKRIDAVKDVKVSISDFSDHKNVKTFEKIYQGGNPSIQTIPIKLTDQLKTKYDITQEYQTRINTIQQKGQGLNSNFTLVSQNNKQYGPFDQVYVCIPFPQCKAMKQSMVKFEQSGQNKAHYACTWVVMVAFTNNSHISKKYSGLDVCKNVGENIASMVNQRSKGNTSEDDLWVFTMDDEWCKQNINLKPEQVQQKFTKKLQTLYGNQNEIKFLKAHRWLYSTPISTPSTPIVGKNIVFGGDWIGQRKNIQQVWDLGPILYKALNSKLPNL